MNFPNGKINELRTLKNSLISVDGHYFKRETFKELSNHKDINSDGIYFLLHTSEIGKKYMYIGQSGDGLDRIYKHNYKKGDWTEGCLFLSTNGSWNATIIGYLEYYYVKYFEKTNYTLTNSQKPKKKKLNVYEEDIMPTYIETVNDMLNAHGISFEEKKHKKVVKNTQQKTSIQKPQKINKNKKNPGHVYQVKKFSAKLKYIGPETKDFLLLTGTEINYPTESARTWTGKYENWYDDQLGRVEKLIKEGIVKQVGKKLVLQTDLPMTASAAAALVSGTNRSGPKFWKLNK